MSDEVDKLIQIKVRHNDLFMVADFQGQDVKFGDGDIARVSYDGEHHFKVKDTKLNKVLAEHTIMPGGVIDNEPLGQDGMLTEHLLFEYIG